MQAVQGWNETLIASQEYDLMFRMLKLNPKVAFDDHYRTIIHFGSIESVSRTADSLKRRKIIESRIDLRYRIKKYLHDNNLLTKRRSHHIDDFIFETLKHNYRTTPEVVLELLGTLTLEIPFWRRVGAYFFRRKMDLKRLLIKLNLIQ